MLVEGVVRGLVLGEVFFVLVRDMVGVDVDLVVDGRGVGYFCCCSGIGLIDGKWYIKVGVVGVVSEVGVRDLF